MSRPRQRRVYEVCKSCPQLKDAGIYEGKTLFYCLNEGVSHISIEQYERNKVSRKLCQRYLEHMLLRRCNSNALR